MCVHVVHNYFLVLNTGKTRKMHIQPSTQLALDFDFQIFFPAKRAGAS